jgi:sugar O-acyltransferase (sialic acid O-acetyltransferase NeuD family)
MNDIILFPFGGNAREAVQVIESINQHKKTWNLLGFIDDNSAVWGKAFRGYNVLGGKDKLSRYPDAKILAVPGRAETYLTRDKIINSLDVTPDRFATLIHPSAEIASDAQIGVNTLIMAGGVITINVKVGAHCVILPNTVISHDVFIDDYSMLGSNVSLSGGVRVGKKCYIGTGSKLIQEIEIGEGSLIGIGSVVLKSVEKGSVIVGNPGRFLRKVK